MDVVVYALLKKKLGAKADLIDGKIPASELPSYVDDVVEYATKNDFPIEGENGKIYVALDTGYTYRWSGSTYIQIGGGSTYQIFNTSWRTTSTTKAFCEDVNSDPNATIGMAYLGGASFTDLPFNGNGDIVVEILQGPSSTKSIHLILTSGDIAPYRWEYTYWNNGDNVSGWIGYQTLITSSNKISADNVNDINTTNKFVTSSEKSTWNDKQDKIDSTHKLSADLVENGTTNKVFTATEQTKLSGIASGAQVNVLEGVQVDGVNLTITNKKVNITGKQNTLVSGTNIKTINNTSLLGSGNIEISGNTLFTVTDVVLDD